MGLPALQRAVGNRAVTGLIGAVQRCGTTPPDECECHPHDDRLPTPVQRQERPPPAAAPPMEPRRSSAGPEARWAATRPGAVHEVASAGDIAAGHPSNEFVLWNYLVGSAAPRATHRARMRAVGARWARLLKADPHLAVRVIGNASATGRSAANLRLARQRGRAMRDLLVAAGVPGSRIEVATAGARHPLSPGATPADLARNRRVEVSIFHRTRVVTDLGPGTSVQVDDFRFEPRPKFNDVRTVPAENMFAARLEPNFGRADVRVNAPPGVEVGFVQFLTADTRRASYGNPPTAATGSLDYSHCMGDFVPCRDVEFARQGFSFTRDLQTTPPTPTVARPGAGGPIAFVDMPGTAFPLTHRFSAGDLRILHGFWSMTFTLVLAARHGADFQPLRHVTWRLDAVFGFDPRGAPGKVVLAVPTVRQLSMGHGPPPGLDIETAMSLPTCRLRARSIEKPGGTEPCRPEVQ